MDRPGIAELLPAGGPVPVELMVGRDLERQDLVVRVDEGQSVMLVGPRRIGKTTLCDAACGDLTPKLIVLERIEVPEGVESLAGMIDEVVRRVHANTTADERRRLLESARDMWGAYLESKGLRRPTDQDAPTPLQRELLALPLALAAQKDTPVVVFVDELQRVVEAGEDASSSVLRDIVDLYSGNPEVRWLVDGSEERVLGELYDGRAQLGKLLVRRSILPTIPADLWRAALPDRFARLELPITKEHLERIIDLGAERPWETMVAAQEVAMAARQYNDDEVSDLALDDGLTVARQRIEAG